MWFNRCFRAHGGLHSEKRDFAPMFGSTLMHSTPSIFLACFSWKVS